jgi:SAM-dependent methyltransferase
MHDMEATRQPHFTGTGPGSQTHDGCSVELYRRARYAGEIDHLRSHFLAGTSVLDLGCGTGLLAHRLLDFGCTVTGVDNSAEMLAHVSDRVRRIHADIERLDLGERFDVVLLPSGLINHADAAVRRAFIAAAGRHVAPHGQLILQCQDAHWLRTAALGPLSRSSELSIDVTALARTTVDGIEQVRMTLRYVMGDDAWTHAFALVPLDEAEIAALLRDHGFDAPVALDDARRWFAAKPRR